MHVEKHTGVLTIWVVSFCWNRLLKALGAAESTRIYWAGGEPFGGKEKALEPIRKAFPELHNKDSLATAEELMPFKNKASSLAAIDYLVCLKSDVFLQSHGGNFGHLMHVGQLLIFLLIPTFCQYPSFISVLNVWFQWDIDFYKPMHGREKSKELIYFRFYKNRNSRG